MFYRQHYLACATAASLAVALYSAPAIAQDHAKTAATETASHPDKSKPANDTPQSTNSAGDTAIVITAQKRAENVQDVPPNLLLATRFEHL